MAEMLPPFGDMTRNNSMTNNSSGEKGAPLALSKFPLIVFVNDARTAGSPPSSDKRDIIPKIEFPHWLSATKLWKHSNTTSFFAKYWPSPAFFNQYQAIVFSEFLVLPLSMSVSRSSIHDFRKSRRSRTIM